MMFARETGRRAPGRLSVGLGCARRSLLKNCGAITGTAYVGALVTCALLAIGTFGSINPHSVAPKDAALVIDVVRHALIGCILVVLQWAIGAGLARLFLGRAARYPELALFGYPLGLVASAVLSAVALLAPHGAWLAAACALAFVAPLATWRGDVQGLVSIARALPGFAVLSAAFGCWLALHWHGPTATLAGSPSGDLTFYASTLHALRAHPLGRPNLGNEGEFLGYYNLRLPGIGAALLQELDLDPFLFVTATVGTLALFGSALALHAYALGRRFTGMGSAGTLLIAALVGAGRYPYWIAESPPVADVVPLSIAILFILRDGSRLARPSFAAPVAAVIGAALTKVTVLPTLAGVALAEATRLMLSRSFRERLLVIAVLACASVFALMLLARFGSFYADVAPFGPESYEAVFRNRAPLRTAWPYLARDLGTIVLGALAFRLGPWPVAVAINVGFLVALGFPFLMRINSAAAAVCLALSAAEQPSGFATIRWHAALGFGLMVPAMVLTDPGGLSSGIAWIVLGGGIWSLALTVAHHKREEIVPLDSTIRFGAGPGALVLITLLLVAVARGIIVPDVSYGGSQELTPAVRDIWKAVRLRTPLDALIFTDQTGSEPTLLRGWNTYALCGERQVFIANYYQSMELRNDPATRDHRLHENQEVLTGWRAPTSLKLRGSYSGFYAVVASARAMSHQWQAVYRNADWALYRWDDS